MLRGYAGKLWLITGLGLVARLALLGYQPLWRDEAFTALAVQRSLGSMIDVVRNDSAPPLFYLVERLFVVASTSPPILRLFPVLAGSAAIPLVAALGRRTAGDTGGVWAGLIGAVAPALVVSSLDARMYVLATALVLASTLCLLRALERPSPLRWGLYLALSILAVYTVYFALFAVFAQVLTVAVIHRRRRFGAVMLVGAVGVATLASLIPWVVAARAQLSHSAGAFWVPRLGIESMFGGLEQFFTGPPVNTWVAGFAALRALELVGDIAGCLLLVALVVNRRRLTAAGSQTAAFLGLAVAIGVGAMLLASFYHPLEDGKYLSTAWAPLYPLLGAGLATLPWRGLAFGAAALTTAVSATTVLAITNPETPLAVAAIPAAAAHSGLVTAYPSEYLLVRYYAGGAIAARTRSVAISVPWFWGTAVYPPNAVLHELPLPSPGAGAVWYVYEPGEPLPPNSGGYTVSGTRCWTGVCVTQLTPPVAGAPGG
ncbi:MAG: glycosyltransferase family 39 protein [Candidatus Dormibacteria bacterium]